MLGEPLGRSFVKRAVKVGGEKRVRVLTGQFTTSEIAQSGEDAHDCWLLILPECFTSSCACRSKQANLGHILVQELLQCLSRSMNPHPNRTLRDSQNRGDLRSWDLLDIAERDHDPIIFRKALDRLANLVQQFLSFKHPVRFPLCHGARYMAVDELGLQPLKLFGRQNGTSTQLSDGAAGKVDSDGVQPRGKLGLASERPASLECLKEGFLEDAPCLIVVPDNPPDDVVQSITLAPDHVLEGLVVARQQRGQVETCRWL